MPTIAVIIPTGRRPAVLSDTLQSVFRQTRPPDNVIISVPQGSRNDIHPHWANDHRMAQALRTQGTTAP